MSEYHYMAISTNTYALNLSKNFVARVLRAITEYWLAWRFLLGRAR